jgi:hypothetical protein
MPADHRLGLTLVSVSRHRIAEGAEDRDHGPEQGGIFAGEVVIVAGESAASLR